MKTIAWIIALITCAGIGFFTGKKTETTSTGTKESACKWRSRGFVVGDVGSLYFDHDDEHAFLLVPHERYMSDEIKSVTTLDPERGLYVIRFWFPGGMGVSAYDDVGIRVENKTVKVLFRSGGAIERYLHDDFKPGVKEGEIAAVRLSSYVLADDHIVESDRYGEIILHPITGGEPIAGRTLQELEKIYDEEGGK